MEFLQLLILLGAAGVIFALLLKFGPGGRRDAKDVVVAGLAAVNITGVIGLGWTVAVVLFYDGMMIVELSICAGVMAVLAAITGGAFALRRSGRIGATIGLLGLSALPTIAVYGFLLYLVSHPIDWR